jgi:hypothetical protein
MNRRYGDAPVSAPRALAAPVSGIPTAVLAMKVKGVRALLQNSIVTGALALALCLLALLGAASSAQALVEGKDFVPGQVVVKPTSNSVIGAINADYRLTTLDVLPGSPSIYLLKVSAGSDTEGVVERLRNDTRLLFAEPNFVAAAPQGDGRHKAYGISAVDGSSEQYATRMLNLPCAAAISLGQGTTVAVLDTGAQLDHPQLAPNF